MARAGPLRNADKVAMTKAFCILTDLLIMDAAFFALTHGQNTTIEAIKNYIRMKISPLIPETTYDKLHRQTPDLDAPNRLRQHIIESEKCEKCYKRNDTTALKAALRWYCTKQCAYSNGYGMEAPGKLRMGRDGGLRAKQRKEVAKALAMHAAIVQSLETRKDPKELERLKQEERRYSSMVDQMKPQIIWPCVLVAVASQNPELLGVLAGPPDRSPSLLANAILEKELCSFEDGRSMTDSQRILFRQNFGSNIRNLDHFAMLREHLLLDASTRAKLDTICCRNCCNTEDPQIRELQSRMMAVEKAIEERLKREEAIAQRVLEEEAAEKERERLRILQKKMLEEKRTKEKVQARRCYAARVLSLHTRFMELLRMEGQLLAHLDEAGGIVNVVHSYYSYETVDVAGRFLGQSWQPGKVFGEEFLWHLLGREIEGTSGVTCMECSSVPSIREMTSLLRQQLSSNPKLVDAHFHRPLDTAEREEVARLRGKCYEEALWDVRATVKVVCNIDQPPSSAETRLPADASPGLRVEQVGLSLQKALESCLRKRVALTPNSFDDYYSQMDYHDRPNGRKKTQKVQYAPFLESNCIDTHLLWDRRVSFDIYLRDLVVYLEDTKGIIMYGKTADGLPKYPFAPVIRKLLEDYDQWKERSSENLPDKGSQPSGVVHGCSVSAVEKDWEGVQAFESLATGSECHEAANVDDRSDGAITATDGFQSAMAKVTLQGVKGLSLRLTDGQPEVASGGGCLVEANDFVRDGDDLPVADSADAVEDDREGNKNATAGGDRFGEKFVSASSWDSSMVATDFQETQIRAYDTDSRANEDATGTEIPPFSGNGSKRKRDTSVSVLSEDRGSLRLRKK
ncbi:hypothetical protein BJ508DRAFT_367723 [Ascobolus immersus RN42]|uniref:Uncharacterized protein n=1 Tax=Ascobolus immersus RN42 TaxID=1160509 RepID=A0A3N4HGK3_ASCIM|nr:hypothetical protein BJ508DRAFT_367723 [Ascobolus immersus RN42]